MIIKNKNPRHFRTPQIPQIVTSRNTDQSTSSGVARSVPVPPSCQMAAADAERLDLGQNTRADPNHKATGKKTPQA